MMIVYHRDTSSVNRKITILKKYFSHIQKLVYEDSLAVTNVYDMLNYIYSLTGMSSISKLDRQTLKRILEKEMINGVLNIPKEYGMFICKK